MGSKWLKLDVNFTAHHKVRALCERAGPGGLAFHIAGLQYAKAHGPEGFVDRRSLRYLAIPFDMADDTRLASAYACEAVGLWDAVGSDGWFIHNWAKYQTAGQSGYGPDSPQAFVDNDSGSEVTARETRESPLYINNSLKYNSRARAHAERTERERPREEAREQPRESPVAGPRSYGPPPRRNVCPDCQMVGGRHLLDCPRGSQEMEGATTFRTGGHRPENGGPSSSPATGCPACAMPWGSGHLAECNYDPRHPLDARPVSGNDDPVMPKPVDFAELRNRLRRGDSET